MKQGRYHWRPILKNKKYVGQPKNSKWDTYSSILNMIHKYLPPDSVEEFDNATDENKCWLIGHFEKEETAVRKGSVGFVFTTKRLINNAVCCVQEQGSSLTAMVDGTYKVSKHGWTLANIGVQCTYYNNNTHKYTKSFMLVACCFMRSKTINAYQEFASLVLSKIFKYKSTNFVLTFAIADYCEAIANGLDQAWPGVSILMYWPH